MPGRKAVPITLIDTKTSHRTKAEIRIRSEAEVSGCSAELKPPRTLSKGARKEWRRLIALYKDLDQEILNDLDVNTIAAYCEAVAVYQEAQKKYQDNPLVGYADGKMVENPFLRIMDREAKIMTGLAEQLCLSPVGRARMGVLAAKKELEDDPTESVLNRYGYA
ncbi:MAG: phage terminase small subunit P27 family [Mogibacterium sp.]|nr:phage terminase small subunit P27 family [Mogibacterium sp.]